MNIVICDDECYFVSELKRKLRSYAALKDLNMQIQQCHSAEALLSMDLLSCDVLFLDIEMPGANGIDAAKQIRMRYSSLIIVFVTGWIEYAPSGYHVNAFRYLLKNTIGEELFPCMDDIRTKMSENAEVVTIHGCNRTLEVAIKHILYFEGTPRRHTLLRLYDSTDVIMCVGKLTDYDHQLAEKGFLRIQKSYLVNMEHIVKMRNYTAFLRNGTELKVSERQYSQIRKQFLMWKGRII